MLSINCLTAISLSRTRATTRRFLHRLACGSALSPPLALKARADLLQGFVNRCSRGRWGCDNTSIFGVNKVDPTNANIDKPRSS